MKTQLTEKEYQELKKQFGVGVSESAKNLAIKNWIEWCLRKITEGHKSIMWPYSSSPKNIFHVLNFYTRLYEEYGEENGESSNS